MVESETITFKSEKRNLTLIISVVAHIVLLGYHATQQEILVNDSLQKLKINFRARKAKALTKPKKVAAPKVTKRKLVKNVEAPKKATSKTPVKKQEVVKQQSQEVSIKLTMNAAKSMIKNFTKPRYPRIARRRKQEGRVSIAFHLLKDGSVKEINFLKLTGHKTIDNTVKAQVQKYEFNELPPEFKGPQVFTLDFVYTTKP